MNASSRFTLAALMLVVALVAVAAVVPEAYAMSLHLPQFVDPSSLSLIGGVGSLAKAKDLRDKRKQLATLVEANLADILKADTADARKKELKDTNERLLTEADDLKVTIDQIERQADLDSELNDHRGQDRGIRFLSEDPKEAKEQRRHAVEAFLRYGLEGISDEARQIIQPRGMNIEESVREATRAMPGMVKEGRNLSTGTSGAVLPIEYWNGLEQSMLEFGGMRPVATTIRTENGNTFTMPTVNDTANAATLVSEASQTTVSVDPTLSSLSLGAYTYRSFMLVSRELLQDLSFNIDQWVNQAMATRLARGLNAAFTTGTGSSQPNGAVTASSEGVTSATGNSIVFNDLTQLMHSLDPAYRVRARFMMHDTTLRLLKQMVDSQSRPLWIPGIALREPDTILGHPYSINQQMSALSSGGVKAMLFGDFSKYIVRDVVGGAAGPVLLRLVERYADYGQVGFFLFSRHDGDLLDAGTDPMKHLVTPSP